MKERIKEASATFFISVTLINAAMLILGLIFSPEQKFGYEVFLYPLIYGLIGVIPQLIMTTKKELSIKQVIIRKIIQLLLLIVLMLTFIFGGRPIDADLIKVAAGVAASVIIIYVLVNIIEWMFDQRTAKSMTEDLMKFQERTK